MSTGKPISYFQCCDPGCALRFPAPLKPAFEPRCPRCSGPASRSPTQEEVRAQTHRNVDAALPPIEALLDNIRSAFNLGAMFRTADGAGLNHLYLCGITPHPEHPKVAKTALGAEFSVPWSYAPNSLETARRLKESGRQLWALEIKTHGSSLFDVQLDTSSAPVVLVVGNEVAGIDPGLQAYCEKFVHIPMLGYKRSLNVAIAFAVAVYTLRFTSQINPVPGRVY